MTETIGQRVKRLREAKGWTIKKLADELDWYETDLLDVECGRWKPNDLCLVFIAMTLGVDEQTILEGEPMTHNLPPAVENEIAPLPANSPLVDVFAREAKIAAIQEQAVPQMIQKCPYTCVTLTMEWHGKALMGIGFSKCNTYRGKVYQGMVYHEMMLGAHRVIDTRMEPIVTQNQADEWNPDKGYQLAYGRALSDLLGQMK